MWLTAAQNPQCSNLCIGETSFLPCAISGVTQAGPALFVREWIVGSMFPPFSMNSTEPFDFIVPFFCLKCWKMKVPRHALKCISFPKSWPPVAGVQRMNVLFFLLFSFKRFILLFTCGKTVIFENFSCIWIGDCFTEAGKLQHKQFVKRKNTIDGCHWFLFSKKLTTFLLLLYTFVGQICHF